MPGPLRVSSLARKLPNLSQKLPFLALPPTLPAPLMLGAPGECCPPCGQEHALRSVPPSVPSTQPARVLPDPGWSLGRRGVASVQGASVKAQDKTEQQQQQQRLTCWPPHASASYSPLHRPPPSRRPLHRPPLSSSPLASRTLSRTPRSDLWTQASANDVTSTGAGTGTVGREEGRGEQREEEGGEGRGEGREEERPLEGVVVALGKFDALHIGHRALAQQAAALGPPCMLSFSNMAQVLKWEPRLPLVAPADRGRVFRLWARQCGMPLVPREHSLEFSEIRTLDPEGFIQLLARQGVRGVVAGANYRFGYRAAGTTEDLTRLCDQLGLLVHIVDIVDRTPEKTNPPQGASDPLHTAPLSGSEALPASLVSSTRVRQALAAGDLLLAYQLLDRPYRLLATAAGPGAAGGSPSVHRGLPLTPQNQPPGPGRYLCSVVAPGAEEEGAVYRGYLDTTQGEGEGGACRLDLEDAPDWDALGRQGEGGPREVLLALDLLS